MIKVNSQVSDQNDGNEMAVADRIHSQSAVSQINQDQIETPHYDNETLIVFIHSLVED